MSGEEDGHVLKAALAIADVAGVDTCCLSWCCWRRRVFPIRWSRNPRPGFRPELCWPATEPACCLPPLRRSYAQRPRGVPQFLWSALKLSLLPPRGLPHAKPQLRANGRGLDCLLRSMDRLLLMPGPRAAGLLAGGTTKPTRYCDHLRTTARCT